MKPNFYAAALLLLLTLSPLSPLAFAGGESSAGGADDYRILPAFFRTQSATAPTPVSVCYEIGPTFQGVIGAQALEAMIRDAFKLWGDYLQQRRLDVVLHNQILIRSEIQLVAGCGAGAELKFYFGYDGPEVAAVKSTFSQPFGFAALTSDSPARGIVWIAPSRSISLPYAPNSIPNWSPLNQGALAALLLHEVGHVFGNDHVDGTVMTSQIGLFLEGDARSATEAPKNLGLYSKIDAQRDLYVCMECAENYPAAAQFGLIEHPDSDWDYALGRLLGQSPLSHVVSASFERASPLAIANGGAYQYPGSGTLIFQDAQTTHRFPVEVEINDPGSAETSQLFVGLGGTSDFHTVSYDFIGQARGAAGTIPVSIRFNMNNSRLQILPIDQPGTPRPLFVSE